MRRLNLKLDAERTAKRAYYAGRDRPAPAPGAAVAEVDVPLAVRYRTRALAAFVAGVDRAAHLAPRDASVRITVRRMIKRRARAGRDLDAAKLSAAIAAVLVDPAAKRLIKPGRTTLPARINANDLARTYGTVVTVDRRTYTLRLFKGLKLAKRYGIAIGAAGYDTPRGLYRIQNKAVNPAWTAPNRAWAGALAGQTIPGGAPNNPLKARWLGIVNGVGIHGTGEPWSIGTRASHGCIRMKVPDVIDLYPRVPVGTPVLIA